MGTNGFTVSRWELGQAFPSPYYVQKLAVVFGQSPEALGLLPPSTLHDAPHHANILVDRSEQLDSLATSVIADPLIPPSPYATRRTGLIGREREIQQLLDLVLSDPSPGRVAICGLPGVGKTSLALHLASDPAVTAHFPDGILWAGLGPHPQLLSILSRWGDLLGLSPDARQRLRSIEDGVQAVRYLLGQRQCLILIDDAWTLTDALLCCVGGAHCTQVLTTRSPTWPSSLPSGRSYSSRNSHWLMASAC